MVDDIGTYLKRKWVILDSKSCMIAVGLLRVVTFFIVKYPVYDTRLNILEIVLMGCKKF